MKEIRAESWNHLQDVLFAESWRAGINRFRSPFAFRGISLSARSELTTGLQRLGGDTPSIERHLLRNFRKYASLDREIRQFDSPWEWLALAQHHGLPTRLLDWTYSPFIALHFATQELAWMTEDAAVWCVNFEEAHTLLPKTLLNLLNLEGSNVFTVEMLSGAAADLQAFDELSHESFALFFEPPSLDARIVNQFALFSLMSNPEAFFTDWLATQPDLAFKVLIPSDLKWEIRDKLDQANITERVLFPGLDGLSRWLVRHYVPRERGPDKSLRDEPHAQESIDSRQG